MFESALIRRPIHAQDIDVGLIAETLMFYQNTHILFDPSSLIAILKNVGADNFKRLMDEEYIKASYFGNLFGAMADSREGITEHSFVMLNTATKNVNGKPYSLSKGEEIEFHLRRGLGNSSETKRLSKYINSKVPLENMTDASKNKTDIVGLAYEDIYEVNAADRLARAALHGLLPSFQIPTNWKFEVHKSDNGFYVNTNYDFASINRQYHRVIPPEHSTVGPSYILSHILDARADLMFASRHLSELITNPAVSEVIHEKMS